MKQSVLVVEDEGSLAKALRIKLEEEGFSVTVVSDGERALSMIGQKTFDLILLDLVLPVASGFEVLQRTREKKSHTPIFVLSNLHQHEDHQRALELGAEKYFVKSEISLRTLVATVKARLS